MVFYAIHEAWLVFDIDKAWVSGRSLAVFLRFRITRRTRMSSFLWILWGRGMCDGPIHPPEESYR